SLSMDDPNRIERRRNRVGANLCDYRFDALTDRGGAGHHLDAAIGVDPDANAVERSETALLDKVAHPEPDQLASLPSRRDLVGELGVTDQVDGLVEETLVVAGVQGDGCAKRVEPALERHCRLRNEVDAPELDGVLGEAPGDLVHEAFAHEGALVTAG